MVRCVEDVISTLESLGKRNELSVDLDMQVMDTVIENITSVKVSTLCVLYNLKCLIIPEDIVRVKT